METESDSVINMRNSISATQLEKVLRLQLNVLAEHPEMARALPPLMVWGAPGLGKSSIIRGIADELGIQFIDVRLAQREPVDIRGLPVPDHENKKVDWMVSGEWPREGRGILLFDEVTAADRSLQVAAYELILDRRLGNLYSVPDGWYICAAGNRVEDGAVSTTMSSALANRFMHVELRDDVDSWMHWAAQHDIHPAVMGFLRFRPDYLFCQKNENLERGWPTPRSWERVSIMMGVIPKNDESLLQKLVCGLVGNRGGIEFCEYYKLNVNFDDVRNMMLNPKARITIPQKIDQKYAFCANMAYHIWRGKNAAEAKALLDGFYRISENLTSDFACMVMMDAMTGCGQLTSKEAMSRLFYHKGYKEWEKRYGNALKQHIL